MSNLNKTESTISPLLLICTAFSCIGASISIGKYGIFVPLFALLGFLYLRNTARHIPQNLPTAPIWIYFAYVIVFIICTLFNGDGDIGRNSLIVNYAVCILIFLILGQKASSRKAINQIVGVFIFILVIDCLITVAQYYNLSIGWSCWFFFNSDVKLVEFAENIASADQKIGESMIFCPGLFPSQVFNGYVVSSLGVFSLFKLLGENKFKSKIFYLALTVIIFWSLFIIQQRMAFILFLAVTLIIFYRKHRVLTIAIGIGVAFLYVLYGIELSDSTVGRFSDFNDNVRDQLYATGIEYVLNHLLVGGRVAFSEQMNLSVHNVFLNAFMYGGLVGGVLVLIIYFRMCIQAIRLIFNHFDKKINIASALAYSILIYNLISLTHNNSLLTGDPIIWVLYALMLQTYRLKNGK